MSDEQRQELAEANKTINRLAHDKERMATELVMLRRKVRELEGAAR